MRTARTLYLLLIIWPWSLVVGWAGMTMGITKYVLLMILQTWSNDDANRT